MASEPLLEPVTAVAGVGPARARLLEKLGVATVDDLLRYAPRRYVDARRQVRVADLVDGQLATVVGVTVETERRPTRTAGLWLARAVVADDAGGRIELVFFARGKDGQKPRHVPLPAAVGERVVVSGVARRRRDGSWFMQQPEVEPLRAAGVHTGRLVPEYGLTAGLTQRTMRRIVRAALDGLIGDAGEMLPAELRQRYGLLPRAEALRQLHFPDSVAMLAAARRRLAFEELLLLRAAVSRLGRAGGSGKAAALPPPGALVQAWFERLPFSPTAAQRRAAEEIERDLRRSVPMRRLLQGDVGSGKTLVAAYALLRAVEAGGQAALLAPSEILAAQHARTLRGWFEPLGVRVHLLTASTPPAERRKALADLAVGKPVVAVGTHALLGPSVRFRSLVVLVVDEQHRFGVRQRNALAAGPAPPHLLVVSATPIPRTLAMCLYGDLDVSVLDELPPGRLPVDTRWVRPARREEVYEFVRRRVEAGEQAYVVFPSIGDGDDEDADEDTALLPAAEKLANGILRGVRVGVLHGRQPPQDQEKVMRRFCEGDVQVLMATSVIEVGVDVPRASVIVIEGADRFGLAQLHQLRGRVGRDGRQAYCFLIADPATDAARRRLQAIRRTTDGFALAAADLELRGPGELLGVRQAGLPDLSPLALAADRGVLEAVDEAARTWLAEAAAEPERHAALWTAVQRRFGIGASPALPGV